MRQYRKGVGFVMHEARHFTSLDRNQKARIIHSVETYERLTKAKGRRNGEIGIPATIILRVLLNGFHNAGSGRCCPSYEAIRKRTGFCRATIAKALAGLEKLGVLVITRRLVRVRSPSGEVVVRNGSNLYGFRELPRFVPIAMPAAKPRFFPKVYRMRTNHIAIDQSAAEPMLERALRWECDVKFGSGINDWRSRARATMTIGR
jgi:hypothetical protein